MVSLCCTCTEGNKTETPPEGICRPAGFSADIIQLFRDISAILQFFPQVFQRAVLQARDLYL